MKSPILYVFAGLPGSGKTTIAKMLASYTDATYLRIDTIEQGLNLRLPTWQEILARRYEAWSTNRVVVDTAGRSPDETFSVLLRVLAARLDRIQQLTGADADSSRFSSSSA